MQDAASTINFYYASMTDWVSKKGLGEALEYHGKDQTELKNMDFHNKVVLLCTNFKLNDICSFFKAFIRRPARTGAVLNSGNIEA